MLLPTTYAVTIAVLVLCTLCWGTWANTLKKSRWRFELYYIDFAIGAVLAGVIAAYTVGSMGSDISVQDNFLLSGKKQVIFAFIAGCVINLAIMLMVAATDLAGMSVAVPIIMGLALIVGAIWNYVMTQTGSIAALVGGILLVIGAVIVAALAKAKIEGIRSEMATAAKLLEAAPVESIVVGKKKKVVEVAGPGPLRGVWLAIAGGFLMGAFYPLVGLCTEGELGLTNPYAVTLIFSVGMLASTFIYNLYFMNLPVKGLPTSFFAYFTGTLKQHFEGMLGGALWIVGTGALFAGLAAQGEAKVPSSIGYGFGYGAGLIAILWGLLVWKEFANADGGVKRLLGMMTVLLAVGIVLVAIAPQL